MRAPGDRVPAVPEASADPAALAVRELGRIAYDEAWELQKQLVEARLRGVGQDTLLVCEHEPVVTAGRGTVAGFLRQARFPVVEVERGGQATWHGPGQIVVYPIVLLQPGQRDLHRWMRALEQACLDALCAFGLAAGRREGATGVWVDGTRKLVSIGVAARRWVAWHGLALNHDPDLAHFAVIDPCGFDASVMTSMAAELGERCPPREQVVAALVAALRQRLQPFRAAPLAGGGP